MQAARCAQSLLARSQVLLERLDAHDDEDRVSPSFADYLVHWLLESASSQLATGG